MIKKLLTYILLLSLIFPQVILANAIFPGAEGFGTQWSLLDWTDTSPDIYLIDTTNPTTARVDVSGTRCPADSTYTCGTDYKIYTSGVKTAFEASGARVVMIERSGVSEVNSTMTVSSIGGTGDDSNLYYAGGTAPFPGFTLRGASTVIQAPDVFLQHFRSIVGDAGGTSYAIRDGITVLGEEFPPVYGEVVDNIVLDHVSVRCATDGDIDIKSMSATVTTKDVTVSNSIIAETLHGSQHPSGAHSFQSITDSVLNLSYIGNLFVDGYSRNPQLNSSSTKSNFSMVFANNYMYNLYNPAMIGANQTGTFDLAFLANIGVAGNQSTSSKSPYLFMDNTGNSGTNEVYMGDTTTYLNDCPNYTDDPTDCFSQDFGDFTEVESTPVTLPSPLTLVTTANLKQSIIDNAGAYPAWRDAADLRSIDHMENEGGGQVIDCVDPAMANYTVTGTSTSNGSSTTVSLQKDKSVWGNGIGFNDWYNNMSVTLTDSGNADCYNQTKTMSDYDGATYIAAVPTWANGCVPLSGETFSISFDCSEGNHVANGWASLETAENYRELTIPDNPHDDRGDGWTNLEGFIFGYSAIVEGGVSVTLTGTAISGGVTESQIVTGGKTIIETISNDTWVDTMCDDNAFTTAHIAGFTFDQSEPGGWANQVTLDHTMCTRDSDYQLTWILPATVGYDITTTETGTDNVPATSTTNSDIVVASPTFPISVELEPPSVKISVQHSTTGQNAVFSSSGCEVQ